MYNKAICQKSTGQIKYIIVATAPGFLEKVQPGTDEFAETLDSADYHMAVREPEKYKLIKTTEWVKKSKAFKGTTPVQQPGYDMVMIAKPAKKEKEIEAPPVKGPVKEKKDKKDKK